MPEYRIWSKEIYDCISYVTASDKEEALRMFKNGDASESKIHEYYDNYGEVELTDIDDIEG